MKKFIIITFVFVMLLSINAMATETRVMTMGDNNNVLLDDANIWLYPSRILDYPNLATAELGYWSNQFDNFGVNWKFDGSTERVIVTYFSTRNSMSYNIPNFNMSLPNRRIDLFYGQNLGGNKFGVHVNYNQSSNKYENNTSFGNSEEALSKVDISVGLTEASDKWDVALDFGFGSFTNKDNAGLDENEADGFNNIGFMGRYFIQRNPNYTMIPHAAIYTDKFGVKDASGSNIDKLVMIDVGWGMNFTPSNHVLGVFDFGVMYSKTTMEFQPISGTSTETTTKNTALPYFKMGIDGDVFKWLDVRFGATSYWNSYKYEAATVSQTQKYASNRTYFGLGFKWGHLNVDTEANPGFFLDGPDFLSGADQDMSWRLSATYAM